MTVKKNILIIIIFIFTILALFINKLTSPRVLSTNELLINGLFLFDVPKEISDFKFFTSDNLEFKKSDLIGKWTLMYFGFTRCPDECPTSMYQMSKLIKVLKEKNYPLHDKQWVLVSIDPERDTPDIIKIYLDGFENEIFGITGDPKKVFLLSQSWGVLSEKIFNEDGSYLINHSSSVLLLKDGKYLDRISHHAKYEDMFKRINKLLR